MTLLGEAIKAKLEEAKISAAKLARKIDMDSGQMYRCINGQLNFTDDKLRLISEALDFPFEELIKFRIMDQILEYGVSQGVYTALKSILSGTT